MQAKSLFFTVMVDNVSDPAAQILKQEMLSKGGECSRPPDVIVHKAERSFCSFNGDTEAV
ncbi:MAG: hypothetical protein ACOX47_02300 [Bacillota bacterium]